MDTGTSPAAAAGASGELPRVSFDGEDAPIRSVVVYTNNMAEVTRVVHISPATATGLHEVELTGLPGGFVIEEQSVAVKGSGYCTILDVSFSDLVQNSPPDLTAEQQEAKEAERERVAKKIEVLMDEQFALSQQFERSLGMRQLADRVADRVTNRSPVVGGIDAAGAAAAASASLKAIMDVDGVSKALDWWAARSAETDQQLRRATREGRRVSDALKELTERQNADRNVGAAPESLNVSASAVITLDVEELCPIELEVTYIIRGAKWSPAYDLRVDTQTNSMSCTYYGRVSQTTKEDWEGVALSLSTAQPTFHGNPPSLQAKTVSYKSASAPCGVFQAQAGGGQYVGFFGAASPSAASPPGASASLFGAATPPVGPATTAFSFAPGNTGNVVPAAGFGAAFGFGGMPPGGGEGGHVVADFQHPAPPPPPPPPAAKDAVAQVEGGACGAGAVSFAVRKPATVRGDGQTKKLTIGVLKLSTAVTHYIVPSKEPAAYLQAKATNNTDYLLLASNSVSVFLDNSFTSRTSMAFVSPGETFQTFLGMDPTIQTKVAPPLRTNETKGIFGKIDHTKHAYSTSIFNKKMVPVTCVVVDAMPHCTDEGIKVSLQVPMASRVRDSEATTDEHLVIAALDMFGGGGRAGEGGEGGGSDGLFSDGHATAMAAAAEEEAAASAVQTCTVGVVKCPRNHLAWVVNIAPQEEIQIPFEYAVRWPVGKEIQFTD